MNKVKDQCVFLTHQLFYLSIINNVMKKCSLYYNLKPLEKKIIIIK